MEWTAKMDGLLRKGWGDEKKTNDIALMIPELRSLARHGKNAVCGRIHRFRQLAQESNDPEEIKFWVPRLRARSKCSRRSKTARRSLIADDVGVAQDKQNQPPDRYQVSPIPRSKVKDYVDSIQPAVLKTDNTPIWRGAAFPRPNPLDPDALTEGELASISQFYV
jgi:hypothetical protein